jgi:hypothetical protein
MVITALGRERESAVITSLSPEDHSQDCLAPLTAGGFG